MTLSYNIEYGTIGGIITPIPSYFLRVFVFPRLSKKSVPREIYYQTDIVLFFHYLCPTSRKNVDYHM